ncbi:hypothetical protein RV11_GL001410 [Enterococcus phoeniculicola]|nr:hypothetical protein RV11_GL001410 [Enterococcus phoeniculicola]
MPSRKLDFILIFLGDFIFKTLSHEAYFFRKNREDILKKERVM